MVLNRVDLSRHIEQMMDTAVIPGLSIAIVNEGQLTL